MNQKIVLKKQVFAVFVLILSASAFVSCEKYTWTPPKIDDTIPVSFQNEIIPIFTGNSCTDCHPGLRQPDLRPANAYESLINGSYINTSDPESSKLYTQLYESDHTNKCSDLDKQRILAWIKQGAQNN